jgi:hypothetical protein
VPAHSAAILKAAATYNNTLAIELEAAATVKHNCSTHVHAYSWRSQTNTPLAAVTDIVLLRCHTASQVVTDQLHNTIACRHTAQVSLCNEG